MTTRIKTTCILLISIPIFVTLISCNDQKNTTTTVDGMNDSIAKDIPIGKNGKIVSRYLLKDSTERKAGFTSLENGFDSLQIRIWYGYTLSNKEQVIILKNTNSNWSAELYTLTSYYDTAKNAITSVTKSVQHGYPVSGWKAFIKKLLALKILTLPDYEQIPDYHLGTDACGVTVQIATSNKYRIYSYAEPMNHIDDAWQAKNMEQIMELIEDELRFKRIRKF
jgi:hypothetical protein